MVWVNISQQMGHRSSDSRDLAETAISTSSVIASWGVRWSSYRDKSQDFSIGSMLQEILPTALAKLKFFTVVIGKLLLICSLRLCLLSWLDDLDFGADAEADNIRVTNRHRSWF